MKNDQNNQKNQSQDAGGTSNKNNERDQQQGSNKQTQSGSNDSGANQSPSSQNSNISVGNDGKIGKAHDQWNSNDKNQPLDKKNTGFQPNDRQSGDRTDSDIDLPDTDKKTPQMQGNKNKK